MSEEEEKKVKQKPIWLIVVLALLSTGTIAGLSTDWFGYKKDVDTQIASITKEEITMLMLEIKEDRDYYKALYKTCAEGQQILMNDVRMLKTNLMLEHSLMKDLPADFWVKDLSFRMIYVNDHYVRGHLTPRGLNEYNYIGKTDFDVWDTAIAEGFRNKDIAALKSKEPTIIAEIVTDAMGKERLYKTISFQRKIGNEVIGLANIGFYVD